MQDSTFIAAVRDGKQPAFPAAVLEDALGTYTNHLLISSFSMEVPKRHRGMNAPATIGQAG